MLMIDQSINKWCSTETMMMHIHTIQGRRRTIEWWSGIYSLSGPMMVNVPLWVFQRGHVSMMMMPHDTIIIDRSEWLGMRGIDWVYKSRRAWLISSFIFLNLLINSSQRNRFVARIIEQKSQSCPLLSHLGLQSTWDVPSSSRIYRLVNCFSDSSLCSSFPLLIVVVVEQSWNKWDN